MPIHNSVSGPTATASPLGEDVLHIIWRRRRGVLMTMALCIIAATIYLLAAQAVYTVTTQLYVERKSTVAIPDRSQEFLHTQIALLRSTSVLRLALDRPDVRQLGEVAGLDQPIIQVRNRLSTEVGSKDGIITVSLKCSDPGQGAQLLNSIVDTYIGRQSEDGPLPAAHVVVLENADTAGIPKWPHKPQVMALATLLGLLLGSGGALLRGRADCRFYTPDEVSRMNHVPVTAVVPADHSSHRGAPLYRTAEAYRVLSAAIQYSATPQTPRSILITSPAPGDGKTTIAAGLAKALAAAGERTILLDLNLHNPAVADVFRGKADVGLAQVLTGTVNLDQAIQPSSTPGLDLLALGADVAHPAPSLAGESFRRLLGKLTENYSRIVLDAPPVLAFADARIAAAVCNATLLVLRLGKSTAADYAEACAALTAVKGHILGVVVNDAAQTDGVNHQQIA